MAKNQNTAKRLQGTIGTLLKSSPDFVLAGGILLIISLLLLPLPAFALDLMLALNIAISILILMVSVYLATPLDISSFPTILLITTLFRLGLNVATTRLILGEAHAGQIIKAFGTFVIGGNYVVGVIIFIIIIVINFIVIVKGSSRIAEVAARFTLDALPGKQMSIDADLNAGYIDENEARKRRSNLTREADFYGAMDGSAKFIKGDAIAAMVITAVNIGGGFIIGMAQRGMEAANALSTYTILTIGDGLVSQIPALLVSVAAGLVVTRSASSDKLEKEIGGQLGRFPRALYISSGAMGLIAIIPGFPMIPFLLLSAGAGALGYVRSKTIKAEDEAKRLSEIIPPEPEKRPEDQPVEELLKIDPVEIELGYSLISLVDESQGGDLFKRITNVRRQLAIDLGIILPPVRVRDNLQLEPDEYVIKVRSIEVAKNQLYPNMLMAMNPGAAEGDLVGIAVTEPVFGLPATWISPNDREDAEVMGYTVVEAATVLATHLTELLKRNSDKLLTRQDVRRLVDNLKADYPALVDEIASDNLSLQLIQKVLQNLLKETLPIRDIPLILESLLEYAKVTKNVDVLTEYVRHNLSETIKKMYQDGNGVIHAIAIDPSLENQFTNTLQTSAQTSQTPMLALAPDSMQRMQKNLSDAVDEISLAGYMPLIICSAQIRPYFQRLIKAQFPMVSVISYTELPSDSEIEVQTTLRV